MAAAPESSFLPGGGSAYFWHDMNSKRILEIGATTVLVLVLVGCAASYWHSTRLNQALRAACERRDLAQASGR
jgi:hypothetical protein